MAGDLVSLAVLFQASWEMIEGKTLVTAALLEQAKMVGSKLMAVASLDESADFERARVHDEAARAFTLMDRAYEQIRRAAAFLCFGMLDVDEHLPNYRAKRRPRRVAATTAETPTDQRGDAAAPDPVDPA
jgi:hypothetical protein